MIFRVWAIALLGAVGNGLTGASQPASTVGELADALERGELTVKGTGEGVVVWPQPWLLDNAAAPDGTHDQLLVFRSKERLVLVFRRELRVYAACVMKTNEHVPEAELWPIFEESMFTEHVRLRMAQNVSGAVGDDDGESGSPDRQEGRAEGGDQLSFIRRFKRCASTAFVDMFNAQITGASPFDEIVGAFQAGRIGQGDSGEDIITWPKVPWFTDSVWVNEGEEIYWSSVDHVYDRDLFVYWYPVDGQEGSGIHAAFLLDAGQAPHEQWFLYDPAMMAKYVGLIQSRRDDGADLSEKPPSAHCPDPPDAAADRR